MTELNQIYKCSVCGNIVEVAHASGGNLVCCGTPMTLLEENKVEASKEKHVPVIEIKENEIIVKVGSVDHPMGDDHYIEWIELLYDNRVYRKNLRPGDKPEASFKVNDAGVEFTARAYCNLHGLWKADSK